MIFTQPPYIRQSGYLGPPTSEAGLTEDEALIGAILAHIYIGSIG